MKPAISQVKKIQRRSGWLGLAGAVCCAAGVVFARQQFYISYLFAYLFWFGVAMGSLGLLLIHQITGGAWGDLIKPQLEAASRSFPFLAIFLVPILFGLPTLFPWARPEAAADVLLQHKHLYLNVPFFCFRAVFFFGLWSLMGYRMATPRYSALGLVLYTLTGTFAIVDWMMSLEPAWYSTIYAVLVMIGFMLTAFAFVTFGLYVLQNRIDPLNKPEDPQTPEQMKPYWDLGNMILTFVMLWAYMAFSQYLIIWSGNMPEEISWYLHRQHGGWFWVAMGLIAFQFILPFLVLLGRRQKQRLNYLVRIAALLFVLGVVNIFWMVEPVFSVDHLRIHWLDLGSFMAVGGFWLWVFLARLNEFPAPVGVYIPEEAL